MRPSERCVTAIQQLEGFRADSYKDESGVKTIGFGDTTSLSRHVTRHNAELVLRAELAEFAGYLAKMVTVPLTQGMVDALLDFSFNCGPGALKESTLLKLLNEGKIEAASEEFPKWVYAGQTKLPGLVKRRELEREWFLEEPSIPLV